MTPWMGDRLEFHVNRGVTLVLGTVLTRIGVGLAALTLPYRNAVRPEDNALALVVVLGLVGLGLFALSGLRKTGPRVVIDRDGITDFSLSDRPIPWAEVERIEEAIGMRGIRGLKLMMHPAAQADGRSPGKRGAVIWESGLPGGIAALRRAVQRLAPQVPRHW